MLKNHEINDFGLPERLVVIYRNTIVTKNIDLFLNLLTALQKGLHIVDFLRPTGIDALADIFLKLRIFDIFGIGVNGVNSRVTLAVSTCLLKSVEAAGHLLCTFRNGLFEVTACGRNGTEEGNRTGSTIIKIYVACACVESTDDSREVHWESILTRKFLQAVGHLAESLSPTRSRVGHQQYAKTHRAVIFGNSHRGINGCLTRCHRHVGGVGDDDRTLHQLATRMRILQFGELRESLHHLVSTFATGCNNHDICLGLLGDSMLEHGLTRTERARDKARTTLAKRVGRINRTHTRFEQFEWTRFLFVSKNGFLYRPFLHHRHFVIHTLCIGKNGHHLMNRIVAFSSNGLHRIDALERKRHHDLVRLMVFVNLTQPSGCIYLIAHFGNRFEVPEFLLIERVVVLTSLEENAMKFVEVVLKAIVVTAQKTRTEGYLKHVAGELNEVADLQTAR